MGKLAFYRRCVQQLILAYRASTPINSKVEVQTIFDTERDHYQLVNLGWDGHRCIYNCVIHLDIKDGKIWIQRNQTDCLLTGDLLKIDVRRKDVVLGLQSPTLREYSSLDNFIFGM
jgi:hypothetical protein